MNKSFCFLPLGSDTNNLGTNSSLKYLRVNYPTLKFQMKISFPIQEPTLPPELAVVVVAAVVAAPAATAEDGGAPVLAA